MCELRAEAWRAQGKEGETRRWISWRRAGDSKGMPRPRVLPCRNHADCTRMLERVGFGEGSSTDCLQQVICVCCTDAASHLFISHIYFSRVTPLYSRKTHMSSAK